MKQFEFQTLTKIKILELSNKAVCIFSFYFFFLNIVYIIFTDLLYIFVSQFKVQNMNMVSLDTNYPIQYILSREDP